MSPDRERLCAGLAREFLDHDDPSIGDLTNTIIDAINEWLDQFADDIPTPRERLLAMPVGGTITIPDHAVSAMKLYRARNLLQKSNRGKWTWRKMSRRGQAQVGTIEIRRFSEITQVLNEAEWK